MNLFLGFLFAFFGTAIGSFLNVCIDRLPDNRSLSSPSSHCDSCDTPLSPGDLIPVVSYIWLRGRCRHCGASIPWRVFWVEMGTGIAFGFLYWHYYIQQGLIAELFATAFYACLFIVLLVIDLKHHLILNKITYPAMVIALVVDIFLPPGTIFGISGAAGGILNGLIGGVTGFCILLIPALIFRGGMGWGDVKMAGLIGLVVGFPAVFVAVLGAIIGGGVIGVALIALRAKGRREAIPFGPFLSVATIVTVLYGETILEWYLGLFR